MFQSSKNLKNLLEHVKVCALRQQTFYGRRTLPRISIFHVDVRFDTEHTEKTKAGNRVSAEKKGVQLVIVENLGGNWNQMLCQAINVSHPNHPALKKKIGGLL